MPLADTILNKLAQAFGPAEISVEDQSANHVGHAGHRPGGETHFDVRIVSTHFAGLSRVERQRQVYALLDAEFKAGLHALAIKALTPEEAARG